MTLCLVSPSQVLSCMLAWDMISLQICTFCGKSLSVLLPLTLAVLHGACPSINAPDR